MWLSSCCLLLLASKFKLFTVCIYIQLRSWAFQCVYLVFLRLFSQILKLWNSRNRESTFFKQSCEKDLKRKKEKSQTKTRTLSFLASVYINWTRQKHETTWRWIWRKEGWTALETKWWFCSHAAQGWLSLRWSAQTCLYGCLWCPCMHTIAHAPVNTREKQSQKVLNPKISGPVIQALSWWGLSSFRLLRQHFANQHHNKNAGLA